MATLPDLIPRHVQSLVSEALEDTRVVLILAHPDRSRQNVRGGG